MVNSIISENLTYLSLLAKAPNPIDFEISQVKVISNKKNISLKYLGIGLGVAAFAAIYFIWKKFKEKNSKE